MKNISDGPNNISDAEEQMRQCEDAAADTSQTAPKREEKVEASGERVSVE